MWQSVLERVIHPLQRFHLSKHDADSALFTHTLNDAHRAVWDAICHLFPVQAMADEIGHGMLLISWSLPVHPGGSPSFAAPLMIHVEPGLLLALWGAESIERRVIARLQERKVRDALAGYEPRARVPTTDVIRLGDGLHA